MIKAIVYITIAAAIASTACGKRAEEEKPDDRWGYNNCIRREEFRHCTAAVNRNGPAGANAVKQCSDAALQMSYMKNRLIPQECKAS